MADQETIWDRDFAGPDTRTVWDRDWDGPGTETRWDLVPANISRAVNVVWRAASTAVTWVAGAIRVTWR